MWCLLSTSLPYVCPTDHAQTVQVLVCTYGFENHSTDAIGRLELLGYAAFGTFAAAHSPKWGHFVEGA